MMVLHGLGGRGSQFTPRIWWSKAMLIITNHSHHLYSLSSNSKICTTKSMTLLKREIQVSQLAHKQKIAVKAIWAIWLTGIWQLFLTAEGWVKTSAYLYHFKTKKDDHERRRIKGYWDISATFFSPSWPELAAVGSPSQSSPRTLLRRRWMNFTVFERLILDSCTYRHRWWQLWMRWSWRGWSATGQD